MMWQKGLADYKQKFTQSWQKANVSMQYNERDSFAEGYKRLFDRAVELAKEKRIMSGGAIEAGRKKCRGTGFYYLVVPYFRNTKTFMFHMFIKSYNLESTCSKLPLPFLLHLGM